MQKNGLIVECVPKKDTEDDAIYYETYLHSNEIMDDKGASVVISKDQLPESFRFILSRNLREHI